MLNATSATAVLPPEMWARIIDHMRRPPFPWMQGSSCCGGSWSPAPGSSLGVVQQKSIGPDKELIPLSATCKLFHDMLADELQFKSLFVCLHPTTGQLVTHNGGMYPRGSSGSETLIFTDIDYSAFGPSVHRLALSLYGPGPINRVADIPEAAVPICDAVARDILPHMQNVVTLAVHIRVGSCGNSIPISADLARAFGSLQQLAEISFSGCHLPLIPDLRLDHVVRMQTNKKISSLDPFPALKELRNDQQWLDQEGYKISVEAFARLEVLHYCQSNLVARTQWFIEDCKAVRQYLYSSSKPSRLRELVLRSDLTSQDLREVISSLASPSIRIFVSYGIYGNTDEYDDLLKLAINAFPNAAIEFVDVRIPQDTPHEH